jgi:hypothetical protein
MAIDFFCPLKNISINSFVEKALNAGFRGVGVYINEKGVPSFHVDIRETDIQMWLGTKENASDPWTYSDLINFEIN